MAESKYDWQTIENEYVIGYTKISTSTGLEEVKYPTYKELAKKYNMDEAYMRGRGAKGNWARARENIKAKRKFNNLEVVLSGDYNEAAQFDARILNTANRLLATVEAFFDQYDYIELGADGNFHFIKPDGYNENVDDGDPIKNIKVSDLKGLVEVLDKTQVLVRRTVASTSSTTNNSMPDNSQLDQLISQRETLKRQSDGLAYQIEQLEKELL